MWFTEGFGSFFLEGGEKLCGCKFPHKQNSLTYSIIPQMQSSLTCGSQLYVELRIPSYRSSVTEDFSYMWISIRHMCGGGDLLTYRNILHMQSSLTCGSQLHGEMGMLSYTAIPLMCRVHLCVELTYVWISVMWGDGVPSHIGLNMTKRATKVKFLTPWYFLNLGWRKSTE